jgi:uncharacterized protein (DUF2384 family)
MGKPRNAFSDSARADGIAKLVGQVQAMVTESGDAESFDAAGWVFRWLQQPLPALDGKRPIDYLDTTEGQSFIANLLAMMQCGAYA